MNTYSKRLIALQTFLIFVLPVLLLYFKVVSKDWIFFFLSLGALAIYGIIHHEHWTHEEMGLRHDNFKKSFPIYFWFTVLSIGVLFLLSFELELASINARDVLFQKLLLFLPISFFQEFAFRSFLMHRLQLIFKNVSTIVFINAVLLQYFTLPTFTMVRVLFIRVIFTSSLASIENED